MKTQNKSIFEYLVNLIYPINIPILTDCQGFSFTKNLEELSVDNIWIASSLDSVAIKNTILEIKEGGQYALVEFLTQHFIKQIIDFGMITASRKSFVDNESKAIFGMFASLFDANNKTLISFVPPDIARQNKRGFHLPKILATQFAKKLNTIANGNKRFEISEIFVKNKKTIRQTGLDKEHRLTNLNGKIEFLDYDLHSYQSIFIIDDVCTTGATINECALQVKVKFPNIKIYGLAIASNL